jgi:tetratricopeptide (TPR) repeat protein
MAGNAFARWCAIAVLLTANELPVWAKAYAILAGVNSSPDDPAPRKELEFAGRDAVELRNALDRASIPCRMPVEISVFSDIASVPGSQKPTAANIKRRIEDVLRKATSEDFVYIFLSARGNGTRDSGRGFISASDTVTERPDTGIGLGWLRRVLEENRHAKRVLIFADVLRERRIGGFPNRINLWFQELRKVKDVELILASARDQESIEDPKLQQGVFGYYLNGAMTPGANAPCAVTMGGIFEYLIRNIEKHTNSKQTPGPRPQDPALRLLGWAPGELRPLFARGALFASLGLQAAGGQAESDLPELPGVGVLNRYGIGDQFPGDPLALARADFERAAQSFEDALGRRPGDASLEVRKLLCAGLALTFDLASLSEAARRDQLDKAEQLLRQAVDSRADESPVGFNALGIVYLEQARHEEAIRAFQSAIRRAPAWAYPRHNLALARLELGQTALAEEEYREAIGRTPYYPYLYYNLGLLLQRSNRSAAARQAYGDAIRIFDRQADLYARRSESLGRNGNESEARIAAIRARELRRNRAQAINALGVLIEAKSGPEAAVATYEQASAADPSLTAARTNLARAYREMSVRARDAQTKAQLLERAVHTLEEAVRVDPQPYLARMDLARVYLSQGRGSEAAAQYRAVLGIEPRNFEALAGLAEVYERERNLPEAIRTLEQALSYQMEQRGGSAASPEYYHRLARLHLKSASAARGCFYFDEAIKASRGAPGYAGSSRLKRERAAACGGQRAKKK